MFASLANICHICSRNKVTTQQRLTLNDVKSKRKCTQKKTLMQELSRKFGKL